MEDAMRDIKTANGRAEMFSKHKYNIILYSIALVVIFVVYHLLSDGDFSFLLTLAGLVRLFGFVMLIARILKDKSVSGLSLKTIELYAMVFFTRCFSIFYHEGYKPYDKSGDWLYQTIELISFFLCVAIIYFIRLPYKASYDSVEDSFGNNMKIPKQFTQIILAIPCFVLALIIHPSLNRNLLTDVSWTFAMYLETISVIPQLYLFQKSKKGVESWTSHFVFALGLSRFCSVIFWASSYHELAEAGSGVTGGWVGLFVLINQILQAVVVVDYCYYYMKSAKSGSSLQLPGMQV